MVCDNDQSEWKRELFRTIKNTCTKLLQGVTTITMITFAVDSIS